MAESKVKRPLLRYFGGKWQLRHWIIEHFPEHEYYAEPFAGAASILLAKPPAPGGEIINDLNSEVINLFRVMQDKEQSQELMRRLSWTPYAKAELDVAREPSDDPIEKARRLAIASYMSIECAGSQKTASGFRMGNVDLSRKDQIGKRTFRNCATDWKNWQDNLEAIRERLAGVMIYERDAMEFIDLMDAPECLIYIDPPYYHPERSTKRYKVEFQDKASNRKKVDRHKELVERLIQCRAMVIVSGYNSDIYKPLIKAGWARVSKDYRANMSLDRRTECLWLSPSCQNKGLNLF